MTTTTMRNDDKYRWCGMFLVGTRLCSVLFYAILSAGLQVLVALSFCIVCAAEKYKLRVYIYVYIETLCVGAFDNVYQTNTPK